MKTSSQPDVGGALAKGRRDRVSAMAGVFVQVLGSARFAVAVIAVIAVACIVGTILPQGGDAAAFAEKNPAAAGRIALFDRLGLTHVFTASWFIALLCVLATTIMVCSVRRFSAVTRGVGATRRRAFGSLLTHISILLILAGAVVRGVWGEKGYIEFREGQTITHFDGEGGLRALPFSMQLSSFDIETYGGNAAVEAGDGNGSQVLVVQWLDRQLQATIPVEVGHARTLTPEGEEASSENSFRIEVLKYVPDFAVDNATKEASTRSSEPNNPAILVAVNGPSYHNHRWIFAKFPDFTMHEDGSAGRPSPLRFVYQHEAAMDRMAAGARIKSFKSTVKVVGGAGSTALGVIEVNRPLTVNGYTFYQTGYNPDDLTWTSLEVVRDPGVPLVYSGFVLLVGGLFVVFYLNPWLSRREARA